MLDFLKAPGRIKEVDRATERGFARIRQDTAVLSQWVRHLYEENQKLKRTLDHQALELNDLHVTLQHMPKSAAEIKRVVDTYFDMDPLFRRLKHIEDKLEMLELRKPETRVVEKQVPVQQVQPQRSATALKDKLMRRLVRNSKEYIKNMIKGIVHKYGRISALQLREMIVEEQGLCSKSSFYRILDEMEQENSLEEISEGKNKVFVPV